MNFASTMKGDRVHLKRSPKETFREKCEYARVDSGANYIFSLDREKKAPAIAVGDEITGRGYTIKTEMEGKT